MPCRLDLKLDRSVGAVERLLGRRVRAANLGVNASKRLEHLTST
jgi:hypothetical protein